MKILGISAVTNVLSVALIDDDKLLGEKTITGEQAQAENLILFIDRLFKEIRFDKKDLNGVTVTQGPGSYSGIRGSLATAKTLAQSLIIPVVGVSTLEAMARGVVGKEVIVILNACKNELNIARFGNGKRLEEDKVMKANEVRELLKKKEAKAVMVFSERVQKEFPTLRGIKTHPRAEDVARLGLEQFKKGENLSLFELQPQYSHSPNIRVFKHA